MRQMLDPTLPAHTKLLPMHLLHALWSDDLYLIASQSVPLLACSDLTIPHACQASKELLTYPQINP